MSETKDQQAECSSKKRDVEPRTLTGTEYEEIINKARKMTAEGATPDAVDRFIDQLVEDKSDISEDRGIFHDKLPQSFPTRVKAPAEKTITGDNNANACITIGPDRPYGRTSGFGARGHTQCATIDLCVGIGARAQDANRSGVKGTAVIPGQNPAGMTAGTAPMTAPAPLYADPNVRNDAARIYISEKTNVDKNFGLAKGQGLYDYEARSAVAVKADLVRIIGDEGIKLVTRVSETNSVSNCRIRHVPGINLIAGNNSAGLQPLVKGRNLVEALEKVTDHLDALTGAVISHISYTLSFHSAIAWHKHDVPVSPQPSGAKPYTAIVAIPEFPILAADFQLMIKTLGKTYASLYSSKINIALFKLNYLKQCGNAYILSDYNFTN